MPNAIEVTMGAGTLTCNTDYTYNQETGVIEISEIKGDVTITATATGRGGKGNTPPATILINGEET